MNGKKSINYAWIVVGLAFIICAFGFSIFYSFSLFFVALLKDFGWSRSVIAGAFALFQMIFSVSSPLVGILVDRFGVRTVFLLGSLILGAGLALSSFTSLWWHFYIFFGIITGLGMSLIGLVPNNTLVQQWFKGKRGLPMGIVSAGVGVGMLVCVPAIQHLILRLGWRMTYLILAISIPGTIIFFQMFLVRKPPSLLQPANPSEKEVVSPNLPDPLVVDAEWVARSWTVRKAISTKQFWLWSICLFFSTFTNQSIFAHHVAFFVDQGLQALFAAYIVGLIGIVSIPGKILWGFFSDKIGVNADLFFTDRRIAR